MTPEIIANFGDLNGEAPFWDNDSSCLYWTDSVGNRFYRFDSRSAKSEITRKGVQISGFALNEGGGFAIANGSGIWLWDGVRQFRLLASEVAGKKCQMNDAAADPAGRFLAGSYFYSSELDYELGCLFQVNLDGRVSILDEGFQLANGIGFSPDGAKLYVTDSASRIIHCYEYNVETGVAKNRSALIRVSLDEGVPDGLAVDSEGFIWSAQWYGGCIVRYDPDGKVERRISLPAKQPSSLAFGGSEFDEVYVTSASEHFESPLVPVGYNRSGYLGGALYRLKLGIRGKPQFKTRFTSPA